MRSYLEKNRNIMLLVFPVAIATTSFPLLWGIFQAEASSIYGITLDESAMIYPMCTAFFGIFSILGGKLQDRFSPRTVAVGGALAISFAMFMLAFNGQVKSIATLYILVCLPFGGGCGLFYPCLITPLMKWFMDKTGFAMGVTSAGSSVLLTAMTYICTALLSVTGMGQTMFILGITFLIINIGTCILLVNPSNAYMKEKWSASSEQSISDESQHNVNFTTLEMVKTKQFYLLFLAGIFATPAYMLISPTIVTLGISRGLSEAQAVSAVAMSTAASAVGQFILPTLSDKIGRKKCGIFLLAVSAAMSVILMGATGGMVIVSYIRITLAFNGWAVLITPFTNDMFGMENAGANTGLMSFYNTVISFLAPILVSVMSPVFAAKTNHVIGITGAVLALIFIIMIDTDTSKLKNDN